MSAVRPTHLTHEHEGELVVFVIGMRLNKPWRVDLWAPVFAAMPKMLAELSRDQQSGLLGYRILLAAGGPTVVQYWSSYDKLWAYASEPAASHRPAWTEFNRRARGAPGAVGIWHETYAVAQAESMYVGMPALGLAAATRAVPVGRRGGRSLAGAANSGSTA